MAEIIYQNYNELKTEEVTQLILNTLRDLASGQCKVSKANAIFNGVRLLQVQYDNEPSLEGPIPTDSEKEDFCQLLKTLRNIDPTREWQSAEMRGAAMQSNLFRNWLTAENVDSFASMSRFGLLCDRQLGRTHSGLTLERRGQGRHRIYTIQQRT